MKLYKSEFIERMLVPSCQECPHRTEHVLVGKPHQRCGYAIKWAVVAGCEPVPLAPDIESNVNDGTIYSCCPLEDAGPGSDCGTSATARTDNG